MTAVSARTLKEARAVLYPWAGVILLCAFPLLGRIHGYQAVAIISVPDDLTAILFRLGVFGGIPLLACLAYGNELRYRTLDLLLSQPVNRLKIWREKGIVTVVAVLTSLLIATLASRSHFPLSLQMNADVLLFLIVVSCSASFWTLVGKSTLGGFVLNIGAMVLLISMKTTLLAVNSKSGYIRPSIAIAAMWVVALVYSGFMLWLGRWMLVRRQSNGDVMGPDVMGAIPGLLPVRIASLFRCRPNQRILNLIRKEVQLLRPLWLFMTLYVIGWSALAVSSLIVPDVEDKQRAIYVGLVGVRATYTIIALMMAASVAYSEERVYGVQLWHLVLPISIRTQWLIRVVSAMTAAVLCTIAVPTMLMALARVVLHPEFMNRVESLRMLDAISVLIFSLCAFWCATVARDMIRTSGLMFVAGGMLFVTFQVSVWLTEQLIPGIAQIRWLVISRFQLNPGTSENPLGWFPDPSRYLGWLLIAFFAVMILHTYTLFRRLPQESVLKLLRPLVPYLALIALLASSFTVQGWKKGWGETWELFNDTETAIVELPPDRPYKVEDLAGVASLPDRTRQWLRDASMILAVSDFRPTGMQKTLFGEWRNEGTLTIRFQSGMACKATFLFSPDKSPKVMGSSWTCN